MPGDIPIGEAFTNIIWYVGELAFRLVPGTILSLSQNINDPVAGPVPSGIGPIAEPVTTESVVTYLERISTPEQYSSLVHNWEMYVAYVMALSLVLLTIVIYCSIRVRQLRYWERKQFEAAAQTVVAEDVPRTILRWKRIIEQVSSDNEQNWRLAILEADIMLSELLDREGHKGDTIADKLKNVDRASFNTIDFAWEGHKVRNRIAHEGASMHLTDREVRRVIHLYERVFREFGIIE
ncbi:MAG: hypothetical protein UY63_C0004G0033 [Parcubacteria group bacterium GW2011_GWA2_51_10]|nr:MAG: hypothetical protein UY63_C0004G0033 [Parcubacteria group bacterium GW2011_GWA2_51_10]